MVFLKGGGLTKIGKKEKSHEIRGYCAAFWVLWGRLGGFKEGVQPIEDPKLIIFDRELKLP